MSIKEKSKHILAELWGHAPFTLFGASVGIIFMLLFRGLTGSAEHRLFEVFHPAHVVLSAMVTASMFELHVFKKRFFLVLIVGYLGSVGIATLSDIVIPHVGARLFGLDVPRHGELHAEAADASDEHHDQVKPEEHDRRMHLAFVEEWYIVNPAALLGVIIAFFIPHTKFPHAGHVLISTWASSSYLLMNMESAWTAWAVVAIFVTLFIAVWLPCCISDIVFPLMFVKSDLELRGKCLHHRVHSHAHHDVEKAME